MKDRNQKTETRNQNAIRSFQDLFVWQKSHALMLEVYEFTKFIPGEEKFNRISQIKRSVSSAPANIAEGFGRFHYQENVQFCRQARASLTETQNHLLAARDLKQAPSDECNRLIELCEEVIRILNAYIGATQRIKYKA